MEEAEGIIANPWEVSLTYPSSRSYLDKYLSNGVVKVAMPRAEKETSTFGQLKFPDLDLKRGPTTFFPLPSLMKAFKDDLQVSNAEFQIKDPYHLVRPDAFHTSLTPPPGCTIIYDKDLEMGIWFPLTPFVKEILNSYNLALSQISPSSQGGILTI